MDFAGSKLVWPVWEAVASWVLKTQRSEDPESKSMFMVWPPMLMGERYSTSPCSGVAVTTPVPAVALVAAETPALAFCFLDLSSTTAAELVRELAALEAALAFIASTSPWGRAMLYFL